MGGLKCPSCALAYTTKEQRGTRLPRILKCGHTCCEACIRSRASQTHVCTCPVCKDQQSFPDSSSIQAVLLDSFALGSEAAYSRQYITSSRGPSTEPFNLTMMSAAKSKETGKKGQIVLCDECGTREATCRCDTCPTNFCKLCFDQLHRLGKTMRKHQPRSLSAVPASVEVAKCKEHDRLLEFFCTTDSQVICTFCAVMGEHKQHDVVPVLERNRTALKELKPALDDASKPYIGLKQTAKKLEAICNSAEGDYITLIGQVQSQFQHLHCLLQLRLHQLLTDMKKIHEDHLQGVQDQLKTVTSKIDEFKALQKEANSAVAASKPDNATHLLEQLKSFTGFPCFLVDDIQDHKMAIELTYDSSLKDMLKTYGEVRFKVPKRLSLVSLKDLPEGYTEEELDDTDADSEWSMQSICGQSARTSSVSGDELLQAGPAVDTLNNKRVMVSHIRDPSSFYVQLCSSAGKLLKMQNDINAYCLTSESRLKFDEIKVGDVYLALFTVDNNWYRCRVLRMMESDVNVVDGTTFRRSSAAVEVFYVDYGNSEVIPLTRLRRISPRFEKVGHLAIRCSLFNVVPKEVNGRWKKDSSALFGKLALNRKLILREVERHADILVVDLLDDSEGGCGDVRTSISDALVFLGVAAYHVPDDAKREKPQSHARRQYYSPAELQAGQVTTVLISCIHHPHRLFVQVLGSNVEYIQKMLGDLQRHCNQESNELDILFAAQVGMVCLAKFPHDKLWYRGRVVRLVTKSEVEVLYVDYGNQEVVPISWVRRVPDKFMRLPIQAIPVMLADVAPVTGSSWPDEVKLRLNKLTLNQHMLMKVHAHSEECQRAKVTLYIPGKDNVDTCVNAILVKENLAVSTGPLSLMEQVPTLKAHLLVQQKNSVVEVYEDTKAASKRRKRLAATLHSSAPAPLLPPSHSAGKDSATVLMAALEAHLSKPEKDPSLERPKENFVPVHVTYPKSPQHFYVRQLEDRQSLEALTSRLQSFWNMTGSSGDSKENWNVGDWCTVKCNSERTRARVAVVGKEELEVFLVDSGKQVVVPKGEASILPEILSSIPAFARSCHLADMIPAGGSKSWSKTAEEFFAELFATKNRIFMVQLGEEVEGSLPVDIIIEEIPEVGALEPIRKEYHSVRQVLKDAGYGFIPKSSTKAAKHAERAVSSSEPKVSHDSIPVPDKPAPTEDITGNSSLPSQEEPESAEGESLCVPDKSTHNEPTACDTSAEVEGSGNVEQQDVSPSSSHEKLSSSSPLGDAEVAVVQLNGIAAQLGAAVHQPDNAAYQSSSVAHDSAAPHQSGSTSPHQLDGAASHQLDNAADDSDNAADDSDSAAPDSDSAADSSDSATDGPDSAVDGSGGAADGSDDAADGSDGAADGSDDAACQSDCAAGQVDGAACHSGSATDQMDGTARQSGGAADQSESAVHHLHGAADQSESAVHHLHGAADQSESAAHHLHGAVHQIDDAIDYLNGAAEQFTGCEKKEDGEKAADSVYSLSSEDSDEEIDFLVIQDDKPLFKWPARTFPKEKQLLVMPSHIDEDAVIYVQVLGKDIERYRTMKLELEEAYSSRPKPQHSTLRVGQACIARYSCDNLFYRAVILNSGEKGIEVRFVDYGTTEYVSPDYIFTDLMFEDVPLLCLEVEMYGLKPFSSTGAWPLKALDTVHYTLVEQNCSMVVKERPTETSRAKVLLYLPDGVSLYDFMLETGMACKADPEPESNDEPDKCSCLYKSVELPKTELFPVVVTNLVQADVACVQLAKFDNAVNDEQKATNSTIESFVTMSAELQEVAEDCPLLENIKEGTPCLGKYGYDKLWYRGLVLGTQRKKVSVLYVDYGNSEVISRASLRVLPPKYFDIPIQCKECRLHGVHIVGDEFSARKMLSDILFEGNNTVYLAKIKNRESAPIEIDLLSSSSMDLVYKPLAEKGYITIDDSA